MIANPQFKKKKEKIRGLEIPFATLQRAEGSSDEVACVG